jgi:hypothetical protein
MKTELLSIEELFEKTQEYSRTTIELVKLNAIQTLTDTISSLVARLALFTCLILAAFMVNIGVALWLGAFLGASYYGFFVVAASYAGIAFMLHFFQDWWIKIPISNAMLAQFLPKPKMK